ncbi:MAG: YigZ family protein [Ruminococcaceae bacterium]|nr:YigZ family protein [Oscillospiraceae bacterium]MBQ9968892.1 YigZ family protein [Oscillospiraceae bacterium]
MKEYVTIAQRAEDDFFERKSQFIGYIAPVSSEEEALAFLAEIRAKHRDARHNCFAYILQNGVKRASDDGEPQGTAGVPIMEVVEREGLTDVIVVVTRYFGGILLGAGGLVRAYAHAAKLAVDAAQRKVMSPAVLVEMQMDYNQYGRINNVLSKYTAIVQDTAFTDMVTMRILFIERDVEAFRAELTEMTAATVEAVEVERLMGEFPL